MTMVRADGRTPSVVLIIGMSDGLFVPPTEKQDDVESDGSCRR
jgi:hypothetical protein